MKKIETRYEKIKKEYQKALHKQQDLETEKFQKSQELKEYTRRHSSLRYIGIETSNVEKLKQIYKFFDDNYPVDWEGGLRCDDRGMCLVYWLYDDPDYLIFYLGSTSQNICFSGSTNWLVYAPTLEDKVKVIKSIKEKVLKIIKE